MGTRSFRCTSKKLSMEDEGQKHFPWLLMIINKNDHKRLLSYLGFCKRQNCDLI